MIFAGRWHAWPIVFVVRCGLDDLTRGFELDLTFQLKMLLIELHLDVLLPNFLFLVFR